MTLNARPNRQALTQGIDVYRDAMRSFVLQQLRRAKGVKSVDAVRRSLSGYTRDTFEDNLRRNSDDLQATLDVNHFSRIIGNRENWDECFASAFSDYQRTQNLLRPIADARNQAAHPGADDIDRNDAHATLTQIVNVLRQINNPGAVAAVEDIRSSLINTESPPSSQTPNPGASLTSTSTSPASQTSTSSSSPSGNEATAKPVSKTNTGLKPWLDVISPHPDILSGDLAQAEFAADLQQVADGKARAKEYSDPVEFFRRTYLTPGIRTLLVNTLRRINGKSGDPVIQTKTGFGGGKTHSLIALYHLVTKTQDLADLTKRSKDRTAQELSQVFAEADVEPEDAEAAKVAVLIGTYISPTDDKKTASGDPLNTLWGQMAYQLGGQTVGGQAAYNLIGEAARQGTAPGGAQLDRLFKHIGPCVILIDELVAYVRNVPEERVGSVYTFIQALSESVRRNANVVLVVTLPESEEELGGPLGYQALSQLERVFGRIEAVRAPLETTEAFEVVRRRLFEDPKDPTALEETCEKFAAMYSRHRREYPDDASEPSYLERLKQCYPIHPEIFDRLYNDWSTIHRFQRTRGVLRLMALWIKRLYSDRTRDPLILPANLPLSDSNLSEEFIKLLSGNWNPVVSEIDGTNSRTDKLDIARERWMQVGGAAKRITRTVFLGSVPAMSIHGIDQRQIRLGVVQPTESASVYNEARNDIAGKLYYLHESSQRFFFHTEENLNKVHADRVDAVSTPVADRSIVGELREAVGRNRSVIVCPETSDDVPDTDPVRFVILNPDKHLPSRQSDTDYATPFIADVVSNRGETSRIHRNTIVFITAKADEIRALRNITKSHLAWDSILNGERKLNLTGARLSEVRNHISQTRIQLGNDLTRSYRWVVAPSQPNPQQSKFTLNPSMTKAVETGEIVRSADELLVAGEKLVDEIAPSQLARLLKKYIWDNEYHITIDALWNLFTSHVYMPRLRNRSVLQRAIDAGTLNGDFGYADGYTGEQYQGLRFKDSMIPSDPNVLNDASGLIVAPEMAALELEERLRQLEDEDEGEDTPNDETEPDDARVKDDDKESTPPPAYYLLSPPKRCKATILYVTPLRTSNRKSSATCVKTAVR